MPGPGQVNFEISAQKVLNSYRNFTGALAGPNWKSKSGIKNTARLRLDLLARDLIGI